MGRGTAWQKSLKAKHKDHMKTAVKGNYDTGEIINRDEYFN